MVRRTLSPGYAQTKLATSFPGHCKISPSYIKEKSVVSINKENNSKLEVRPANIYILFYNDHNIQTGHHFSRKRK